MGKSTRDRRDIYYRKAKEEGWRARSAFKLLQIDESFDIFSGTSHGGAVDLCAAPGSWSQVLSRRLPAGATIVSVDLQPMAPLDRVHIIEGDITKLSIAREILSHFSPDARPSLVICDGAPDVTGMHDVDQFVQSQLLLAALALAVAVLQDGGTFVAKIFRGRDSDLLFGQLRLLFAEVTCAKPKSSRGTSVEAFVVCKGFHLPTGMDRLDLMHGFAQGQTTPSAVAGSPTLGPAIVPYIAAGDSSRLDSDCRYGVAPDHVPQRPVAPPTEPAYRRAKEMRSRGNVGTTFAANERLDHADILAALADPTFVRAVVQRDLLSKGRSVDEPEIAAMIDESVQEAARLLAAERSAAQQQK
uniref:Putative tRNA (cytidine(32)/guanosine(34)-2'-O)-methyltransferase n=1 Tax=Sexangularia sp. CB-2014 TaxID=1486929 RepID=A0A7S1VFE4_9EUKA|mmetsp:Transcript_2682/g.8620  ORF Transcript_2682/g.8620 Transcript_2682/m.8620 type:complete len:357 (+) Transcript_2682:150-1220(+)